MPVSRNAYFSELLTALWLRPESALWYAHMLAAAESFGANALPRPSMEFGCMDGVNTFVLLGGHLPCTFDVFAEVQWDSEAHRRSTLADDYFDTTSPDAALRWDVGVPPLRPFEHGVEWKASHVEKAARLNTHATFTLWQPGTPLSVFADDSLGGIWAPNVYWMADVPGLCAEFARIVRPDGRIVAIGPDRRLLDHMLQRHASSFDPAWIADLDRGRHRNAVENSRTLAEWTSMFEGAGLRITRHAEFIPAIVGEIYEIGLRPMFPVFMHIYESLRPQSSEWLAVKQAWVSRLESLLVPFLDDGVLAHFGDERLWHIFELTPAGAAS